MKQVVGKRINKKRYPLLVSLPGGVDGLYTRGTITFSHLTNHFEFSWTHFPVYHNKWPKQSADTDKRRDTARDQTRLQQVSKLYSKQIKRFLATATVLNTNETSKYTYELLVTSAYRLLHVNCFHSFRSM